MNSLRININSIGIREVKETIAILDKAFEEFGIDFYLIGARARDFWLLSHNIPPAGLPMMLTLLSLSLMRMISAN